MELATVLGLMGVITNTYWPLIRERKFLLSGQILGCIFMGLHFSLLGAYTGAAVMAVAGIQALLAIPLESHPKFKSVYFASLLLTPLVCIYTWQGFSSIFSSLALILFCIGNLQVNTKHLRIFLILCIFSWIGHNVMVSSYPALLSNFLALLTSIYALVREFIPNERLRLGA
jgi:hypothetical protein